MFARPMKGYRRLWLATVQLGWSGWMIQVGLFITLVSRHSASVMAAVILIATLPALVLGPAAGAWLDRHVVPRLTAGAAVGQAVLLPLMGWLVVHHIVLMTGLYAVFNLLGTVGATARQQLRYRITPPARWADVNARLSGIMGITTIVGALLGGTVAVWGLMTLLIIASLARILAAGLLVSLDTQRPAQPASIPHDAPKFWVTLLDGFRALRTFPAAASVIVVGIAWGLIGGSYDVLLSDYGVRVLRGGGWGTSGLYAADGLGVLIGTIIAARIPARLRPSSYGLAYFLQGLFWLLFALSHVWDVSVPWLFAMRIASGLIIAWDTTLLLETVPPRLHSRVYALHNTTYGLVGKVSLALTALLMAWLGPRGIAVAAGVGSMLVGTLWWMAIGRHWPPTTSQVVPHTR